MQELNFLSYWDISLTVEEVEFYLWRWNIEGGMSGV